MFRAILELFPIVFAVAAIFFSSQNYNNEVHYRKNSKTLALLSILSATLLIIAQSSWYVVAVVLGRVEDTDFANYIWTVFNTITMIIIILSNKR